MEFERKSEYYHVMVMDSNGMLSNFKNLKLHDDIFNSSDRPSHIMTQTGLTFYHL